MSSRVVYKGDNNQDRLSKRFVYLSTKLGHFWQRWRREHLVGLREVHRGKTPQPVQIGEGDVALVDDENKERGLWKAAILEKTIVGKDG